MIWVAGALYCLVAEMEMGQKRKRGNWPRVAETLSRKVENEDAQIRECIPKHDWEGMYSALRARWRYRSGGCWKEDGII